MNNIRITVQPRKSSKIQDVCREVKELSEMVQHDIEFDFNRVKITTHEKSISEMIDSYLICRSE